MFRFTPTEYPDSYNNSVWFFTQSKYLLWVFAGEWLRFGLARRGRALRVAATVSVLLLAAPSTLPFFHQASEVSRVLPLSREVPECVDFLNANAPPGSVVMADRRANTALLAFRSHRTQYLEVHIYSFLRREEIRRRLGDYRAFWSSWREGEVDERVRAAYGVDHVVSSSGGPGMKPIFSNSGCHIHAARNSR